MSDDLKKRRVVQSPTVIIKKDPYEGRRAGEGFAFPKPEALMCKHLVVAMEFRGVRLGWCPMCGSLLMNNIEAANEISKMLDGQNTLYRVQKRDFIMFHPVVVRDINQMMGKKNSIQ